MEIFRGKASLGGIGKGTICYIKENIAEVRKSPVTDIAGEQARYLEAIEAVDEELRMLYLQAKELLGEAEAEIFRAQSFLIKDEHYTEKVLQLIAGQQVNAEFAVHQVGSELEQRLRGLADETLAERAQDVAALTERLLTGIRKSEKNVRELPLPKDTPIILAAEKMSPGDFLELTKYAIQGLVLRQGGVYSHTAILASGMGLPFLTGVPVSENWEGKPAIVDAPSKALYIEPENGLDDVTAPILERKEYPMGVMANVGTLQDVKLAKEFGAQGIGLVRSEIFFLGMDRMPTEEEQVHFYREILQEMGDREVIIRTLDLGEDKQLPYLPAFREGEQKKALQYPKLIKAQLRALYMAGVYGNLKIMYPMLQSPEELIQLRAMEEEVKRMLQREGRPYKQEVPVGVMIETPQAAQCSDKLAEMAAFFSIGTNDLMQYTYGFDRETDHIRKEGDKSRLWEHIRITIENAHKKGIPVGVCGELATDPVSISKFAKMNVDYVSVSPHFLKGIF